MQRPSLGRALMRERTGVESVCDPAAPVSPLALLIDLDGSTDRLARMRAGFRRPGVDVCQTFNGAAKQMRSG
jgi:hypothetical protein